MKLSELLRNKIFWSIDLVKRGIKKKYFKEIQFLNENPNDKEVIEKKQIALKNILTHAITTTEYYKKLTSYNSVNDFPVVNKNIIRAHSDDFKSIKFSENQIFKVRTSGSTGTPFEVFQNKLKKIRNIADNLYFSEKAGFRLGFRITYFRMWKAFEQKSSLVKFIQNIVPIDVFDLQKDECKLSILTNLSKSSASNSWLGYASAFESICKYLDKNNNTVPAYKLKSAIAISESLNTYTKQKMKTYFDVNVVSRYSNVENGILAQQPLNKDYFLINEASYLIEILNLESDTPVKDGKIGRIVVTDLYNYAMPMIRYDTGDVGIKKIIEGNLALEKVHGRKIDTIYNTSGEVINVNLILLVNNYPELKQCQLIQKSVGTYHIKLNIDKEFLRLEQLKTDLKQYLGKEATITNEYVDEIPLLASGKRRVMVNEMNNKG
ncbi:phenylacetate--CoA ligase family protein [Aquimarina agarilytica]|uniref:coenzyme F390 synthetase n=1 Tax=Aquimarina agarilytica TaxID=1087449 RepID=UPI000288C0F4|nr:coenzyme F390 synthetase [Aquimarina agarilytica]